MDDGGDSGEPPVDDGGVAGGGLSTGQVGFANLVLMLRQTLSQWM